MSVCALQIAPDSACCCIRACIFVFGLKLQVTARNMLSSGACGACTTAWHFVHNAALRMTAHAVMTVM